MRARPQQGLPTACSKNGSLVVERRRNQEPEAFESTDRAWLVALLGSVREAVICQTADGVIREWSPGAERLFGYRREDAVGRPYDMLVPPEGRASWRRVMEGLRGGDGPVEVPEMVHLAKGGQPLEVAVTLAPVRVSGGRFEGTWSIASDLSQHRLAEVHRVEFLALLGHELRNPLGAMISAIALLERPAVEEAKADEALQILKRQGRHLSRLVDGLLEVSRLTRGRIDLRPRVLDLGEAVELAVRSTRAAIEERGHRLWVSAPTEPVAIEADPDRFEQALTNLLLNAANFTETGGEIWVAAEATRNGEAVVRIRDDGIGIEPELLPRVFDPFVQGPRRPAESGGTLGIGLTVARKVMELQGGTVEAYSDGPGKGTEVVVRLPAIQGDDTGKPSVVAAEGGASPRRRRILLVDDHLDAANALSELLASFGHQVEVALDGATALSIARAFEPEVVLLDLGLPGMDGYQVARRLRREPALAGALLVAVTGYGHEEARQESRAAGFDLHLVKPVDPGELQELLVAQEGDAPRSTPTSSTNDDFPSPKGRE